MYGFFILLPLTAVSVAIGSWLASSTQVSDYVIYISELPFNEDDRAKRLAHLEQFSADIWKMVAYHLAAYIILCYAMVVAVRTISPPLPEDQPKWLRFSQLSLEAVFVSVPSLVLLWVSWEASLEDKDNPIHWIAIGALTVGLLVSIVITVTRQPLELFTSSLRPISISRTDALAALTCLLIGTAIAFFFLEPLESAYRFGLFPVLMLATAVSMLTVAAVFSRYVSPIAIMSLAITVVLVLHIIDLKLPSREFRHTSASLGVLKGKKPSVEDVKASRYIPTLRVAFLQWLNHRRSKIDAYSMKGAAFPVLFVTAQGGGMYAAYHPALSLARLTDACNEIADHIFGISSVSGGGLGSAVYAELLRAHPAAQQRASSNSTIGCTGDSTFPLQTTVYEYFTKDFLSPVIASAFIFDVPSFFLPQLRLSQDRATALEASFELGWNRLPQIQSGTIKQGLAAPFYGRWTPEDRSPALFMSATGVNFGIPVLISQIDWSHNPFTSRRAKVSPKQSRALHPTIEEDEYWSALNQRLRAPEDNPNAGVANLLDFRPDIQLNLSTAVTLSARFPFVTPPGKIAANPHIEQPKQGIFSKTKVLELTDGGFYDNSGSFVASDILREMARLLDDDPDFRVFSDKVRLNVIRFTDTPTKRQAEASEGGHFELVTPLVAYNAVRLSRGVQLTDLAGAKVFDIHLLDEWYDGTLNWLLSQKTLLAVQKRSSWIKGTDNLECCLIKTADMTSPRRIRLEEGRMADAEKRGYIVEKFVPNQEQFEALLQLVVNGAPRTRSHRWRSVAAQP